MSYDFCPRCSKEVYIGDLKLGRVISKNKDNAGSVEGLCPKCNLFIAKVTILDIEKTRPLAPKNYKHEFKEWKLKK